MRPDETLQMRPESSAPVAMQAYSSRDSKMCVFFFSYGRMNSQRRFLVSNGTTVWRNHAQGRVVLVQLSPLAELMDTKRPSYSRTVGVAQIFSDKIFLVRIM